MKPATARRLTRNRIGMLIGMGLMLLAAVGEWLGWWRDLGLVVGTVGLIATLWFGFTAADEVLGRIEPPLEQIADDMATVRVVLGRIATRLGAGPTPTDEEAR
jgi:hypothetical protein